MCAVITTTTQQDLRSRVCAVITTATPMDLRSRCFLPRGPMGQTHCEITTTTHWGKQRSRKQCSRTVHMHIFVKTMVGGTIFSAIAALDTVGMVKTKTYDNVGIPPGQQRLLLASKPVVDYFTMLDYDIQHKTTLQVAWRNCGGMHTGSRWTVVYEPHTRS